MAALKSSKNQASFVLLRHGYVWNRKTTRGNLKSASTREYVFWAKSADLGGGHAKEVLDFCVQTVEIVSGKTLPWSSTRVI